MLRYISKYLELVALREGTRKIGLGCITAGLVAVFVTNEGEHIIWSLLLLVFGFLVWLFGLIKTEQ